jgi:hypothetical protein
MTAGGGLAAELQSHDGLPMLRSRGRSFRRDEGRQLGFHGDGADLPVEQLKLDSEQGAERFVGRAAH